MLNSFQFIDASLTHAQSATPRSSLAAAMPRGQPLQQIQSTTARFKNNDNKTVQVISIADFVCPDWDSSKLNLDAAAHISIYGRPK